jgi:hypothetical protein
MWELFLKHWNGISLFLESEQTPSPTLQLYNDAAGSKAFGFCRAMVPRPLAAGTKYQPKNRYFDRMARTLSNLSCLLCLGIPVDI